ncbi:MAG: DUF3450 domain-containing protein [Pseudodesulfovibrio sp.]|nr:DUF3450 domain-containing protein [Pseudodesulfovibrio sp.]
MLKYIWLSTLIFFSTIVPALAVQSATAIHKGAVQAITADATAQKEFQQWADQREELSSEIRDMKMMHSWLEFQNTKYQRYLEKQKDIIAELERCKEEAQRIQMELEPFLETIVDKLSVHIAADLPFLQEERTRRIAFLHDSLDDYHLELSEKLRRVFEALQIETEYGRTIETVSCELSLQGVPTQVSIFRLGRTALFYQTEDASTAGFWDRKKQKWQTVGQEFTRDIQRAKDMASRKRAVELLSLPIGEAQ